MRDVSGRKASSILSKASRRGREDASRTSCPYSISALSKGTTETEGSAVPHRPDA